MTQIYSTTQHIEVNSPLNLLLSGRHFPVESNKRVNVSLQYLFTTNWMFLF